MKLLALSLVCIGITLAVWFVFELAAELRTRRAIRRRLESLWPESASDDVRPARVLSEGGGVHSSTVTDGVQRNHG